MPANEEEIEEAENEGIKTLYLATPTKIMGKEGKVTQIKCIRMKLGELDATGRRKPIPIQGSEFIFDTDMIIPAIGQSPNLSLLSPHYKFNLVRGKRFEVDPVTLETNVKGIFAGGDAVTGPNIVIEAMAAGRKVAISIDRYLNGKDMQVGREGEGAQESKIEADIEGLKPEKRKKVATLSVDERKGNFKEVVLGFSEEEAIAEAKRCLNCGVCSECMECVKTCDAKAIDHTQIDKEIVLEVGAIILAIGTEHFDAKQKNEYGYGRFPNVITSMKMERILSASGPTSAEVIRQIKNILRKLLLFSV
jgi:heterodisulfide reductase subunit A-like polyferredoxin